MTCPVDVKLCVSLWPQAELTFYRSVANSLCHRSFFTTCKHNTLNVKIVIHSISLRPQVGLTFYWSVADSLGHRNFVTCKYDTLNLKIAIRNSNNNSNLHVPWLPSFCIVPNDGNCYLYTDSVTRLYRHLWGIININSMLNLVMVAKLKKMIVWHSKMC